MRIIIFLCLVFSFQLSGQYTFTPEYEIKCTEVKSQDRTGTCWSFATTSFLESEIIKSGKGKVDLSEMFIVRNIYKEKAINYVLRQGKANYSQGSLAHDQLNAMQKYGVITDLAYPGNKLNSKHDHSELEKGLKGFLDGVIAAKKPSPKWMPAFDAILDVYLGKVPEGFYHDGAKYTPEAFASFLSIDNIEYVGITSFNHHPFGNSFILEIPDNFSNGKYHNVALQDLLDITYQALKKGYTVAWDGDVSEKAFKARSGLAVLPANKDDDAMANPVDEIEVTQQTRQDGFFNYTTTDDHLMHIVGTAKDQKGNRYFKVKNSWGEISEYKGYIYMSEAYFLSKTVSIYLNKAAVSSNYLANL
jgi:bleomycin hydrolase